MEPAGQYKTLPVIPVGGVLEGGVSRAVHMQEHPGHCVGSSVELREQREAMCLGAM